LIKTKNILDFKAWYNSLEIAFPGCTIIATKMLINRIPEQTEEFHA